MFDKKQCGECFEACVMKWIETIAAKATKLSGWGGYRDIHEEMKLIATYTAERGQYHILNATSMAAATAV